MCRAGRNRDFLVWFVFRNWRVSKNTRANKGKSLINLIDPRLFPFYLEILESRMRPCGVINTVGGTRITDRHLLPVDGPRPWPGCQAPGKISIVSFCVTQVSPLFLLFFFLFWVEEETARNREGEKERTWCTVAGHSNSTSHFYFLFLCAINCRTCFPLRQMLRVSRCLI